MNLIWIRLEFDLNFYWDHFETNKRKNRDKIKRKKKKEKEKLKLKDKKLNSLEYSSNLIMNRLKYQISKLL